MVGLEPTKEPGPGAPGLCSLSGDWLGRGRVELLGQGLDAVGEIFIDLRRSRDVDLGRVAVVRGPPQMVLQPLPSAEVVHVDDALADVASFRVEGHDRDVEILGIAVRGRRGRSRRLLRVGGRRRL